MLVCADADDEYADTPPPPPPRGLAIWKRSFNGVRDDDDVPGWYDIVEIV